MKRQKALTEAEAEVDTVATEEAEAAVGVAEVEATSDPRQDNQSSPAHHQAQSL